MAMAYFNVIGDRIATRWRSYAFDTMALPDIACDVLTSFRPCDNVSASEIIDWVFTTNNMPPQPNLESDFGEPPLTVFAHPQFFIEVIHWVNGTTTIHQHGFSGAFAVLEGSSIQSRYKFDVTKRINANALVGRLSTRDVLLLRKGDVQPIASGSTLIHSVFHLDSPSVTIVIRTHKDVENQPQYRYLRPHLAFNPFYKDIIDVRRLQMLKLLSAIDLQQFELAALRVAATADILTVYHLLSHAHFVLGDGPKYTEIVDQARLCHGSDLAMIEAVIREERRQKSLMRTRKRFKSNDLRFFLGLLLSLDARDSILKLIAQQYTYDSPIVHASRMAFELWPSVVPEDLNTLNRDIFAGLLEGLDVKAVAQRIEAKHSQSVISSITDNLIEYCRRIRNLEAFRPLLNEQTIEGSPV
jgi:predicted metal-dependent enzyme (double-stranded beta helix superfamily)